MTDAAETRALLLDIEGTVTPISFVHDILFPFARNHARDYLNQHSTAVEVQEDFAALVRERSLDQQGGEQPPEIDQGVWSIDAIVGYVNWLIDRDRKSPALKSLQAKIWEQGYRDGTLKAPLFDDVVPNLRRLRSRGIGTGIFSSGSVLAQQLLLSSTPAGDLTVLLRGFFDTTSGPKRERDSYLRIAAALGRARYEVLFVSDTAAELDAAVSAGMATALCWRDGGPPPVSTHPVVTTLAAVCP